MRATLYSGATRINYSMYNCTDAVIREQRVVGDADDVHTEVIMRDSEWDVITSTEFLYNVEHEFTVDECDRYFKILISKDTGDIIENIIIYAESEESIADCICGECREIYEECEANTDSFTTASEDIIKGYYVKFEIVEL